MRCYVPCCKNNPDDVPPSAKKGISFYGLPSDVCLRAAWLKALGKQDSHVPDSAVVCSQHFLDDDIFETKNGLRQICTGAIPSMVQVCMICLDTDSKLFLMSKHKLEEAYKKLIGDPVCDQGNLKQTLCVQCAHRLINFSGFRDKGLKARALMMDLVKKHELITIKHINMINHTKNQLKSNLEVTMLGPDHCDLYILEDASEDKQTESFPSLFTATLCTEGTVVKNEEKYDSPAYEDANNADSISDEFVASNEDLLPGDRIMLETRLLDDALRKGPESNQVVEDQVAETINLLKCESVSLECTLCSEEFVSEHAYVQHMQMYCQNGDGDADCGTSQVCKPHTFSSCLTKNKQTIQELSNAQSSSAPDKQTSLAPLSTRLAMNNENNVKAEEAGTIQKSKQAFKINNEQLNIQSHDSKSITNIYRLTNCVVELYDVLKKPIKGVLIQNELLAEKSTAITAFDSRNEDRSHTIIQDIGPVTDKVKVNKRNAKNTSKSETNCSKDNKSDISLEKHWFHCDICKKKFIRKSYLVRHMKGHTDVIPFACRLCEFNTHLKDSFISHMRTHTGEKTFVCKLCTYKCKRNNELLIHLRSHTGEKPYSCKLCQYKTAQSNDLVIHMRTHTGEKPYMCLSCEFKSSRISSLVRHMRIHTGEKPYACKFCKYKCNRKSHLVGHMKTHTGEKPYSCRLCTYKCIRGSQLVNHMRTHTGEKP